MLLVDKYLEYSLTRCEFCFLIQNNEKYPFSCEQFLFDFKDLLVFSCRPNCNFHFFIMYSSIGSFCVFLMLHHFSVLLFHAFLSFSQLFFYPCFLKTKSIIIGEIIKRILILISNRTLKRPDIRKGRISGKAEYPVLHPYFLLNWDQRILISSPIWRSPMSLTSYNEYMAKSSTT